MADESWSIERFEGDHWGEPAPTAGTLVSTVYRLRRLPVGSLGVEDHRLLIGQAVALPILVPRALRLLSDRPLVSGDHYPGDLLGSVLRVRSDHWAAHPDQLEDLLSVVRIAESLPGFDLVDEVRDFRRRTAWLRGRDS